MNDNNDKQVLTAAYEAWMQCGPLREKRRRLKGYTYGRQWDDIITTPEGKRMSEGEYASMSGKTPLTNNLIRQLVKSVVGRFRYDLSQRKDDGVDVAVASRNMLEELDCRMLEEFLISGCAVQRIVEERRIGGDGVWVDNVSPERFFVNRFSDPRSNDVEIAGMLHDMSLREVIMRFGRGEPERVARLSSLWRDDSGVGEEGGEPEFFRSAELGRCRVIEVWTLETRSIIKCHDPERAVRFTLRGGDKDRLATVNRNRRRCGRAEIVAYPKMTVRWHYRYFAPNGEVLQEGDSPYAHGLHPFAIKFYPMTDGEIHSFVEDIVDQQRYINRLITLIDHIMTTSAKGVLLFPVEALPKEMDYFDVSREWSRPNGVLPYCGGARGLKPEQVSSNGANAGASELLAQELKLIETISGVSGALQGHTPPGNMSASAYENSMRNSEIALLDIFNSFMSFRLTRNRLIDETRVVKLPY